MEAKPHPPTPKKLRDARRRGEIVHSADLASAMVFVVLVGSAWFLPGWVIEHFQALWRQACDPSLWAQADARWIDVGRHATAVLLLVCVPVCALAALGGTFGSFVQVGGLAAWMRLQPNASRLNPATGLQRLFSLDSLIDLAKMVCKVMLLGAMLYAVLYGSLRTASRIGYLSPAGQLAVAGHVLMSMLGWAAVILVAMAPLDYLHRHFQFMKRQRMSFDELVREHQDTEGSPLNQQRRRSVQLEAAFHSVADRVGASTVVVRSLDLAVALQYLAVDTPPIVMAVGRGSVAAQIHQLAAARSLYIETNAVLAERLARDVRPDQPVPPTLMAAMRQVWNHARGRRERHADTRSARGRQRPHFARRATMIPELRPKSAATLAAEAAAAQARRDAEAESRREAQRAANQVAAHRVAQAQTLQREAAARRAAAAERAEHGKRMVADAKRQAAENAAKVLERASENRHDLSMAMRGLRAPGKALLPGETADGYRSRVASFQARRSLMDTSVALARCDHTLAAARLALADSQLAGRSSSKVDASRRAVSDARRDQSHADSAHRLAVVKAARETRVEAAWERARLAKLDADREAKGGAGAGVALDRYKVAEADARSASEANDDANHFVDSMQRVDDIDARLARVPMTRSQAKALQQERDEQLERMERSRMALGTPGATGDLETVAIRQQVYQFQRLKAQQTLLGTDKQADPDARAAAVARSTQAHSALQLDANLMTLLKRGRELDQLALDAKHQRQPTITPQKLDAQALGTAYDDNDPFARDKTVVIADNMRIEVPAGYNPLQGMKPQGVSGADPKDRIVSSGENTWKVTPGEVPRVGGLPATNIEVSVGAEGDYQVRYELGSHKLFAKMSDLDSRLWAGARKQLENTDQITALDNDIYLRMQASKLAHERTLASPEKGDATTAGSPLTRRADGLARKLFGAEAAAARQPADAAAADTLSKLQIDFAEAYGREVAARPGDLADQGRLFAAQAAQARFNQAHPIAFGHYYEQMQKRFDAQAPLQGRLGIEQWEATHRETRAGVDTRAQARAFVQKNSEGLTDQQVDKIVDGIFHQGFLSGRPDWKGKLTLEASPVVYGGSQGIATNVIYRVEQDNATPNRRTGAPGHWSGIVDVDGSTYRNERDYRRENRTMDAAGLRYSAMLENGTRANGDAMSRISVKDARIESGYETFSRQHAWVEPAVNVGVLAGSALLVASGAGAGAGAALMTFRAAQTTMAVAGAARVGNNRYNAQVHNRSQTDGEAVRDWVSLSTSALALGQGNFTALGQRVAGAGKPWSAAAGHTVVAAPTLANLAPIGVDGALLARRSDAMTDAQKKAARQQMLAHVAGAALAAGGLRGQPMGVTWAGQQARTGATWGLRAGIDGLAIQKGLQPPMRDYLLLKEMGVLTPLKVQSRKVAKWGGYAFAGTNAVGVTGGLGYYLAAKESRTDKATALNSTNARQELAKLQADPDRYLKAHYENRVLGLGIGDKLYNANGHLLSEVDSRNGSTALYRRVPRDLYQALQQATGTGGDTRVFVTEPYGKDKQGNTLLARVEIRPPWRAEPWRDAGVQFKWQPNDGRLPGGRLLMNAGIGPKNGLRPHFDGELLLNHRYEMPTQTTLRAGLPTPTQGLGLGGRQQSTKLWSRINFSANAIDINPARTADLTNPTGRWSQREVLLMNARAYLDIGDRKRIRIDGTKASGAMGVDQAYLRARETGFAELGGGADFFKLTRRDGSYRSLNGYYETQLYTPDLRAQLNWRGKKTWLQGSGLQKRPGYELDAALQLTTTEAPDVVSRIPGLNAVPLASLSPARRPVDTVPAPSAKPEPAPRPDATALPAPTPAGPPARPKPKLVVIGGRDSRSLWQIAEKHTGDLLSQKQRERIRADGGGHNAIVRAAATRLMRANGFDPRLSDSIVSNRPGDPDTLLKGWKVNVNVPGR